MNATPKHSDDAHAKAREIQRRYRARHRAELAEYQRQYRRDNYARLSASAHEYYLRTKSLKSSQAKLRYWSDPAKSREKERKTAWKMRGITGIPERLPEICEICRASSSNVGLSLDHNHSTKAYRGMLCRHCNWLLGHARESPELLLSAIQYLVKHGTGFNNAACTENTEQLVELINWVKGVTHR